jgi:hypothetical protein
MLDLIQIWMRVFTRSRLSRQTIIFPPSRRVARKSLRNIYLPISDRTGLPR